MSPPPRLSLHDWSCLRTELVWIYDHAPRDQSRHGTFDHRDGNWAWYLRKGEVSVATKAGILTARAGQWLLVPREVHRHDFSDDAVLISVRFRCQWPSGDDIFNTTAGAVVEGADHPALEKTAHRLELFVRRHFPAPHHYHERQPSDYPLFLHFQGAFFEWLEAWFQARLATGAQLTRHTGDGRVVRAARLLDDTPPENGFPAAALGKVTGVSAVQLNRLFRRQFKLTPLQYWERRRLELARLFLEAGDLPLKEVAARLGFRSDPHFTVWFKRRTRTSPGRYRGCNSRA